MPPSPSEPRAPRPARLILASTSPYRRRLLERLGLTFDCVAPQVDERPLPGEEPAALVRRLALAKAEAVAARAPDALVIGGDQVGLVDGRVLTKPGSAAAALEQLTSLAGRSHHLLTALAVLWPAGGFRAETLDRTELAMRAWTRAELRAYVERDQPLDCAGSYRLEALGVALFERIVGDDPSAIEGLPLMTLTGLLLRAGVPVL